MYLWDVEKDTVTSFDFGLEDLPGTEYGLLRKRDPQNKNAPKYRRYPGNVHWDPEDTRLMALEVYLHQQKLDLTASFHFDDKPHDLLLTSRGTGDDESTIAGTFTARDVPSINQDDLVSGYQRAGDFFYRISELIDDGYNNAMNSFREITIILKRTRSIDF